MHRKTKWKHGILYLILFACCFLGGRWAAAREEKAAAVSGERRGELALLIDDFGYCGDGTAQMLALEIPFTAAVMPFSKCTEADAEAASLAEGLPPSIGDIAHAQFERNMETYVARYREARDNAVSADSVIREYLG